MFSNYLNFFYSNLLIIVALTTSFYSHAFSEETWPDLQDEQDFAYLEIISEPENAQVFINQEYKGVTPCTVDSLKPGTHNIRLELNGYSNFSEILAIAKGENKKLIITLKKETITSSLNITSTPDNALIIMDSDTIGKTPYFSDNVIAGDHKIVLIKPDYYKSKERITIKKGITYSLNEKLISKKKIQNIRRIVFSSLAIGFGTIGAYMHLIKLEKAQSAEKKAWDNYMQINLSWEEYDRLYKIYTDKVEKTNEIKNRRNIYFSLAGVSGIGFAISIPF